MLIYRVLSAIVGIPLLLVLVFIKGGAPFAVAVGALAVIGAHEFYRGVRKLNTRPIEWLGMTASAVIIASASGILPIPEFRFLNLLLLLFLIGLIWELFRKERAPVRNIGVTALGVLYTGWLLSYLILLRQVDGTIDVGLAHNLSRVFDTNLFGVWLVIFAFFTTWACDTGAYFAGRSLGRHKLAPDLSPAKTIEGAVGGVLGSVIVAAIFGAVLGFPMWSRLILGLGVAAFCLLGDLTESAIKREIGVKDFGSLIPGHGGALDRFDSLLFVGPAVYYLVHLMGLVGQ